MGAFATPPPAALSRILSGFDRPTLAGFIEVAIELLDIAEGDPDLEDATSLEDAFEDHNDRFGYAGPGCPVADIDKGIDDDRTENDDPAEEDDPRELNGDEFDSNNAEDELANAGDDGGAGCPISDPGGSDLER